MFLRPSSLLLHPLRTTSNDMRYVERMRLLEYWGIKDTALTSEFRRSQFLVMIDRKPLVRRKGSSIQLPSHSYPELQKSLGEYGFLFDTSNTCLLDAIDGPNNEVKDDVLRELGRCLDAQFVDIRTAMLGISSERERNILAKFQSLSKWSRTYLRCPKCGAPLKMRVSKTGATCHTCPQVYYPTCSPVAITLVSDPTDSHALLVRHKGSPPAMYTALAGFAQPGESLDECCRREVAEEVGLPVSKVMSLNRTQPWPMPNSSLMCAYYAVADMSLKIDACPTELESARWFSREEVAAALLRTLSDPLLKGIPRDVNERQKLLYIPPHGAIAHQMIKAWVEQQPPA
ncbi:hypothetical protein Y032_0635g921 [Ancylostoma ceylanicum]|uniref:NAD(+) diphosphatase n=4 Tax=Ancylostoma ceylanicum TaxID=53326 RepID=A0A016WLQ7_9BILA|nr:hypothetical protein Y032_0635g921 [Ancylostoma ceylanicum]